MISHAKGISVCVELPIHLDQFSILRPRQLTFCQGLVSCPFIFIHIDFVTFHILSVPLLSQLSVIRKSSLVPILLLLRESSVPSETLLHRPIPSSFPLKVFPCIFGILFR